jgi:hypothetical protein
VVVNMQYGVIYGDIKTEPGFEIIAIMRSSMFC